MNVGSSAIDRTVADGETATSDFMVTCHEMRTSARGLFAEIICTGDDDVTGAAALVMECKRSRRSHSPRGYGSNPWRVPVVQTWSAAMPEAPWAS